GGVHAGLEYGRLVPQVGQDLADQRLELARRQHLDRAGSEAPVLGVVDASIVQVRRAVLRLLAGAVGRHRQPAGPAAQDALGQVAVRALVVEAGVVPAAVPTRLIAPPPGPLVDDRLVLAGVEPPAVADEPFVHRIADDGRDHVLVEALATDLLLRAVAQG